MMFWNNVKGFAAQPCIGKKESKAGWGWWAGWGRDKLMCFSFSQTLSPSREVTCLFEFCSTKLILSFAKILRGTRILIGDGHVNWQKGEIRASSFTLYELSKHDKQTVVKICLLGTGSVIWRPARCWLFCTHAAPRPRYLHSTARLLRVIWVINK